jgi:hypothetical protein
MEDIRYFYSTVAGGRSQQVEENFYKGLMEPVWQMGRSIE